MYNTLCLVSSIKIKLVIYCIWLVSFHQSAHILYQFLIFFYFSFFYGKFCSKVYLIVLHASSSSTSFFNHLGILFLLAFSNQLQMDKLIYQDVLLLHGIHNPLCYLFKLLTHQVQLKKQLRKMRDKNVSSLVVIDKNNKPIGIVTERSLVRKICINDLKSSSVLIQDILSSPIITIDSNSPVEAAADVMIQNKVRHLLVVENNDR